LVKRSTPRPSETTQRQANTTQAASTSKQSSKTLKPGPKKAKRKDYYKILGVDKNAADSVIRKAYKKLSLKWHPDKNQNGTDEEKRKAEKMFREINEAMGVLGDKNKRDKYE